MKKLIQVLSLTIIIGAAITLNSCKKETTTAADDSISAQDNATISKTVDATTDDAAAAAGQVQTFSGKTEGFNSSFFCANTVVDSSNANGPGRTITITYNGADCFGVIRTGSITISSNGTPWRDAGAQLTITFNSLHVTDLSDNSTFTINGTHTLSKETAGLEWQVIFGLAQGPVTRHNVGSLSITFPNGTRTWSVDRTRSWTNPTGSNATVSIYTEAANNIDVQGVNRYGTSFTNKILTTIIADASCGFRPYQGEVTHVATRSVDVKYGTNSAGVQIGSPTTCGNGYFISYTKANGVSGTRFVPYW
jgi:hypothetical protein